MNEKEKVKYKPIMSAYFINTLIAFFFYAVIDLTL